MNWTTALLAIAAFAGGVGFASWRRPDSLFRRPAIAVLAAIALPLPIARILTPATGDGAGMGVAFLICFSPAVTILAALAALRRRGGARRMGSLPEGASPKFAVQFIQIATASPFAAAAFT